ERLPTDFDLEAESWKEEPSESGSPLASEIRYTAGDATGPIAQEGRRFPLLRAAPRVPPFADRGGSRAGSGDRDRAERRHPSPGCAWPARARAAGRAHDPPHHLRSRLADETRRDRPARGGARPRGYARSRRPGRAPHRGDEGHGSRG